MSSGELIVRLIAGVGLLLGNGFFVAVEFALTRARQYSEEEFSGPGLERAWEMTQNLEIYLTGCQVGITICSIGIGVVAEPAVAAAFTPLFEGTWLASVGVGSLLAFALINLVHITHGEQTPTYLGVERSKWVCRWGAEPLYWFSRILNPFIRVGDQIAKWTLKPFGVEMTGAWLETGTAAIESRADLRKELGSVLQKGKLPDERRKEVMNALQIGEQSLRDVMVSREEIVALSTEVDDEENFERMANSPQTRYPLVGEEMTDFRGIVYVPVFAKYREEFAEGGVDFEELAAPPMTMAADTRVSDAIDQFQTESQELALVLEDGEVVGLVTVTDTLEAVMGDVEDPIEMEKI